VTVLRPGAVLDHLLGPGEIDFRERLETIVKAWDAATVDEWERVGHLPPSCFNTLGAEGVFRDRWAPGGTAGLPLAALLSQRLALVSSGLALAVMVHCEVFLGVLGRAARLDEQRELLEAGFAGDAIGCFAVTEPTGGSDVAAVRTTARRTAGGWHVRGEKRYISNAGVATHAVVLARTQDERRRDGLSLFVLPLRGEQATVRGFFPKLGTNSCDAAHLVIDGEFAPSTQIGPQGGGLLLLMEALKYERLAVAAQLVAIAGASLRLAAAWARRREQFGARLLDFQTLRHRLAEVWSDLLAVESLLTVTLMAAQDGRDVGRATAALKLRSAHLAQRAVDESLQVLGGRGYTRNFPVERWYRDVRLARIGAGTDEIMRELMASELERTDPMYDRWLDQLIEGDVACLS
jgi:alkylation response protein AidB-like acyl-CoA dehydrogenase